MAGSKSSAEAAAKITPVPPETKTVITTEIKPEEKTELKIKPEIKSEVEAAKVVNNVLNLPKLDLKKPKVAAAVEKPMEVAATKVIEIKTVVRPTLEKKPVENQEIFKVNIKRPKIK